MKYERKVWRKIAKCRLAVLVARLSTRNARANAFRCQLFSSSIAFIAVVWTSDSGANVLSLRRASRARIVSSHFATIFFRCGYRISIRGYVRPSVGPLVRWSVGPLVRWSVGNAFVKIAKSIGKLSFFAYMMHVHPLIGLSIHQSVYLSIVLTICLSTRPSIRL